MSLIFEVNEAPTRAVPLLADRVALDRIGAYLDEVPARGDLGGLEVTGHRLGDLARVDLPVGELDGGREGRTGRAVS